ncbi:glycoside hydrolase family 2 protein [Alkalicoccobacillus murimartini]|uniref:Beta-galactosidase/beta-glucuronidase n=1 Tax=Alkalicoccobacillus murimartini TaxID=171685 RepID=A0ABT9YIW9_9BACI|nr:glycoside hydrolase family 2 TIM barrel-domain containing protein [Alkalicoccobacillus murimartini]MDQ0207817.1 beta-galactosidase/beta-glucuronidase [Alkalicoccobacillus murimartini]
MTNLRPEYPRPHFKRDQWLNLNGEWEFEYDDDARGLNEKWYKDHTFSKRIIVPFCYQSSLSGIGETDFHDFVWYRRHFELKLDTHSRYILHFGAVDYEAWVWVNGERAVYHRGGHTPFKCEITSFLQSGQNTIVVHASDSSTALDQPRGKQYWKEQSENIFYTRTTGIWQTVWLETVSSSFLSEIFFTPDIDNKRIKFDYRVDSLQLDQKLNVEISFKGNIITRDTLSLIDGHGTRLFYLNHSGINHENWLWSPEDPNLFDVTIDLLENGKRIDRVQSYFGMRKIAVHNGQIFLNNKPYYMRLVLDQGYFPEGILTAPSELDLKKDIEYTKELGFNGARKHQKVEDPLYYYWADQLGLLVWGEMANSYAYSDQAVQRITQEWQEVIQRDYNHPSIVAWVPINESWGVPDLLTSTKQRNHSLTMYHLTKSLDQSRLVLSNDGWEHTQSDLCTIHDYESSQEILEKRYETIDSALAFLPAGKTIYAPGHSYQDEPILISEFGGISYKQSEWDGWGYSNANSEEEFLNAYKSVVDALYTSPLIKGFCYTQLTDVEQEINGLLTYDRKPKASIDQLKLITEGQKIN